MNKEYSTILVLVLAFVALYIFSDKIIFLYISLGTGVVSLLLPWIAKNIHFLWMKFSVLLGSVSAVVILTLIFFVIIVPLSFIAKLTGKKFIILKREKNSYFKTRNFLYDKESIENVW
ncbi:MAG: hypothetical protein ACHQFX_16390 [Chitinophagales bacterium]